MTDSPKRKAGKQLIFALVLLAIAIAGYLITSEYAPNTDQNVAPTSTENVSSTVTSSSTIKLKEALPETPVTNTPAAGQVAIEGTLVCLPHKDTSGPQTLECALGMKGNDGGYYAIGGRNPSVESKIGNIPNDARIRVSGTLVPYVAVQESSLLKYGIVGLIEATSLTQLK